MRVLFLSINLLHCTLKTNTKPSSLFELAYLSHNDLVLRPQHSNPVVQEALLHLGVQLPLVTIFSYFLRLLDSLHISLTNRNRRSSSRRRRRYILRQQRVGPLGWLWRTAD